MKYKYIFSLIFSIAIYSQGISQNLDSIAKVDSLQKKSLFEKTMGLFEIKVKSSTISIFPSAGLDPSSGLNLGILQVISIPPKVETKFNRSTSIVNYYTYSTNKWLNLKSDLVLYTPKGYNVNAYVQYLQAPDTFYGIGNDTLNTNPSKFYIHDLEIRGDISKSINNTFFAGMVFDVSNTYTENLGTTTEGLSIPSQKNLLILGVGPYLAFDNRNNVNYPTKGQFITSGFLYYPAFSYNSYSFYRFTFEAKKYMTIGNDFVFATQLFTGAENGDIPFYDLFQLGGKMRLRGISNKYMYIDKNIYYSQAEFRKHIWGRFSAVAFGSVGNTFVDYTDLDIAHLKYVYGAGIRLQTSKTERLNLRIDYGRGVFGDSGVYITMREAF
jgi:hypothetical protein